MGWGSGSCLAEKVWQIVSPYLPEELKPKIAKRICEAFEDMDCDTLEEAEELYKTAKEYSE